MIETSFVVPNQATVEGVGSSRLINRLSVRDGKRDLSFDIGVRDKVKVWIRVLVTKDEEAARGENQAEHVISLIPA